jgi:hypothetical protein
MAHLWSTSFVLRLIAIVAILLITSAASYAQTAKAKCRPEVIPVENEPPPKLFVDPPLADPLARNVAVIQYCTENVHIVPLFGAKALAVTPRVGHLHVRVDDATRVWAEASGNPIILLGLAPGPHKVTIELVNANHQPLDKVEVTFNMPKKVSASVSNKPAEGDLDTAHHPQKSY